MSATQPRGPFCQSCGMPLGKKEDFGTNADGSQNHDFCRYCFQNGRFTDPNITMEQMIDKVAGFMAQMQGMPKAQAEPVARGFIPQLKRWKKK